MPTRLDVMLHRRKSARAGDAARTHPLNIKAASARLRCQRDADVRIAAFMDVV